MPIKNRDGTEYRLQGPNKIMKEQSFWDRNSVELLNFGEWKEVVYKDQQVTPMKVLDEFMSRLSPNEVTFTPPKKVEPKPEPEPFTLPPPPPPVVKPRPRVELEEIQQPVVTVDERIELRQKTYSCLPMHLRKKVDELYGDESVEQVFGKKFSFYGVPMENNDLMFTFWTKTKLENGSIVFEGGVERNSSWWQVQKSEADSGGYIVTTIVSDFNPDMSD
jgi:hypothetical protein